MTLAFITGASSGIGQALAARFHAAGYDLALVARRTADIEAWASERKIDPARCRIYGADVARIDSIVAAGTACLERQGVPDVVIANAGVSIGIDTAERRDLDVFAHLLMTNNVGLAATFHPFVRAMQARGSGVEVVTVSPGYVDTPLTRGNRYGMPFLMQPGDFADAAFRAIESGASYRVIPWQMGVVAKVLRMLPNALFDRVVQGRGRKRRAGE
jgi:short-subunit dehydrogenase